MQLIHKRFSLVFGKIEYLNLLPFHVFMKRFVRYSGMKQSMEYHKSVPAKINAKFASGRVDAAYISSINARRCPKPKLGIISKKEVRSVLVIPHLPSKNDIESATSNALAKILNLKGKVLIGDKALRYALTHDDYIDMSALWYEKTGLPFVFATLCFNKKGVLGEKLEKNFLKQANSIKIPRYLLHKASKKSAIPPKEILDYLQLIQYTFDTKSRKSLQKFLNKAKQKNL